MRYYCHLNFVFDSFLGNAVLPLDNTVDSIVTVSGRGRGRDRGHGRGCGCGQAGRRRAS